MTEQEKIYKLTNYLEGCTNWMAAVEELIEGTDCNPDNPDDFDEVLLSATLMRNNAEKVLHEIRGN